METVQLVESEKDFADRTLEAIALLVGKMGGRYTMPCGIVGPAVLVEMNKLLNPVEVKAVHRVGVRHLPNTIGAVQPETQDVLVFETMNNAQATLLRGVVFP